MLAFIKLLANIVDLYFYMVLVYVILGLLINFNVVNRMNGFVSSIYQSLTMLVEPVLGFIRKHLNRLG